MHNSLYLLCASALHCCFPADTTIAKRPLLMTVINNYGGCDSLSRPHTAITLAGWAEQQYGDGAADDARLVDAQTLCADNGNFTQYHCRARSLGLE